MRAIIVCGDQRTALHGLDEDQPAALIQMGDRPILQHVIEYLLLMGAERIDFVISYLPEKIEAYFGDGARWGSPFTYHLSAGEAKSWRMLRTICADLKGDVLVASAECLPAIQLPAKFDSRPEIFVREQGELRRWSGWCRFKSCEAPQLFSGGASTELSSWLMRSGACVSLIPAWISAETCNDVLAGQRRVLDGETSLLMTTGTQVEKGARIGRNTRVLPSAFLEPPFWIGANCRIGARTKIGPHAIIAENCIIEDDSVVKNSLVMHGTYVGQGLELDEAIVDRNRLVNVHLGAAYLISETFLAGSLMDTGECRGFGLSERLSALVLFVVFSPLWLGMLLLGKVSLQFKLRRKPFVVLPAKEQAHGWRVASRFVFEPSTNHFLHEFVPGLIDVAAGRLGLVGLRPRDATELRELPTDWRTLYLRCKPGLISEAMVAGRGAKVGEEMLFSAEAYYCAMRSARYDISLFGRYVARGFAFGSAKSLVENQ